MTKMKKLASLLLAVVMAMGLMAPAWAVNNNDYIDYYGITESGVEKIEVATNYSFFPQFINSNQTMYKDVIKVPISKAFKNDQYVTTVDLSDLQKNSNITTDTRLDLAESIMQTLGYSKNEADRISDNTKLEILDGEEVTSLVVTRVISDPSGGSTVTTKNAMKSILLFTRKAKGNLRVVNTAILSGNSAGLKWRQSIAVDGFVMESETSKVEYSYKKKTNSTGTTQTISGQYTESSENYSILKNSGIKSGVCYTYTMPASTSAVTYTDVVYTESVTALVHNVNDGASFKIYGNMALLMTSFDIAVSYPWGISAELGDSKVINCTTELTTKYQ